tara:strand:- start:1318 stop:1728 length:411 start_codon:yes stop_codon:yes gene_type:complete
MTTPNKNWTAAEKADWDAAEKALRRLERKREKQAKQIAKEKAAAAAAAEAARPYRSPTPSTRQGISDSLTNLQRQNRLHDNKPLAQKYSQEARRNPYGHSNRTIINIPKNPRETKDPISKKPNQPKKVPKKLKTGS